MRLTVGEAGTHLRILIANHPDSHQFWMDDVSLCDVTLFDLNIFQGHRQLTDLYLLSLCQRRGATLVTFDVGLQDTSRAIVAARSNLVRLLGTSP